MERAATEQWMLRTLFASALQRFQVGEEESCMGDRVDSQIIAAAMRRSTSKSDINPNEAAMSRADRKACRLGDDGSVRNDASGEHGAHAEALVLLIDDGGDDNLACGIGRNAFHSGGAHSGHSAFHVGGAATVDAIAANFGCERFVHHSLNADDVKMAIEH